MDAADNDIHVEPEDPFNVIEKSLMGNLMFKPLGDKIRQAKANRKTLRNMRRGKKERVLKPKPKGRAALVARQKKARNMVNDHNPTD